MLAHESHNFVDKVRTMETGHVSFKPPTDEERRELAALMSSDRVSADCMTLFEADGFLTGLLIGPNTPPTEDWAPMIFGDWPDWTADEAARLVGILVGRADEIEAGLEDDPATFVPWLDRDAEGKPDATQWAGGFVQAVTLETKRWERMITHHDGGLFLVPLLLLAKTDEQADGEGPPAIPPEAADYVAALRAELANDPDGFIGLCVKGISAYWLDAESRTRLKPGKIGRPKRKQVKHKPPRRRT